MGRAVTWENQLGEIMQKVLFRSQQQLVPCGDVQLPRSTTILFGKDHWRNVLMKGIQIRAMKKNLKKKSKGSSNSAYQTLYSKLLKWLVSLRADFRKDVCTGKWQRTTLGRCS